MPVDLTGIVNENEFYTHHYMSAVLESDLKGVLQKWRDQKEESGKPLPHALLKTLAADYFPLRGRMERERAPEARLEIHREFLQKLLDALGYPFRPDLRELDDGSRLPVLGEIARSSGAPELWILEALDPEGEGADPLELTPHPAQLPEGETPDDTLLQTPYEALVTRRVFGRSEPPRWVLLAGEAQLVLLDRGKWSAKRLLRFDLPEILGRGEPSTLQLAAALLHRDSVCPADGLSLLDAFDESSHKHAFAVSEDLKYALREAIELLGNEAVWHLREKARQKVYGLDMARRLTLECLRYMYRLLFLFYIEARPELGYAPVSADAYRTGYSLESLRDLELARLATEESRNGTFIHESLELLFELVYNGFPPAEIRGRRGPLVRSDGPAGVGGPRAGPALRVGHAGQKGGAGHELRGAQRAAGLGLTG